MPTVEEFSVCLLINQPFGFTPETISTLLERAVTAIHILDFCLKRKIIPMPYIMYVEIYAVSSFYTNKMQTHTILTAKRTDRQEDALLVIL